MLRRSDGLAATFPTLQHIADVFVCLVQLRQQALDAMFVAPPEFQSRVADFDAEVSRVSIKPVKNKNKNKRASAKLPAAENACKAQKPRRATKIRTASATVSNKSQVRSGHKRKEHLPPTGDSISPASDAQSGSDGEGGGKAVEEHHVAVAEGRASTDAVIAADRKIEPDNGPKCVPKKVKDAAVASAQSAASFEHAAEAQVAVTDAAVAVKPQGVHVVAGAASVSSTDAQVDSQPQSRAQNLREEASSGASPIAPPIGTASDATAGAGAPAGNSDNEASAADSATGTEASSARSLENSTESFDALDLGELPLGSNARDKRLLWEVTPSLRRGPVLGSGCFGERSEHCRDAPDKLTSSCTLHHPYIP